MKIRRHISFGLLLAIAVIFSSCGSKLTVKGKSSQQGNPNDPPPSSDFNALKCTATPDAATADVLVDGIGAILGSQPMFKISVTSGKSGSSVETRITQAQSLVAGQPVMIIPSGSAVTHVIDYLPNKTGEHTVAFLVADPLNSGASATCSTTVRVEGASLTQLMSLTITPNDLWVPLGTPDQAFSASGAFANQKILNLTSEVSWTSSATGIAAVGNTSGNKGKLTTLAMGSTTISATLNGMSVSTAVNVTPPELVSIQISPSNPSVGRGLVQAFTATGTLTDSTTALITEQVTWSSSNPAAATIDNTAGSRGRATANNIGQTTITASLNGKTATMPMTVIPATLVSIQITPVNPSIARGLWQQLNATGTYSDGSPSQNITEQVTWTSSNNSIAAVNNTAGLRGRVTGVIQGSATITAALGGRSGSTTVTIGAPVIVSIQVTPSSPTVNKGLIQQFVATGSYSDSTYSNVTEQASWSSTTPGIATVSNTAGTKGRAETVGVGSTTLSATLGGKTGSATLNVGPAVISSIDLSPANATVGPGGTLQFSALAHYTDGQATNITDSANWSSSNTAAATINNTGSKGLASAVAVGNTQITASYSGFTATTTLTVMLRETFVAFSALGDTDQTLNGLLGTNHDFGGFNFRTKRFKIYVGVRLLSRINYGPKSSYETSDFSLSYNRDQYAEIIGLTRYFADRVPGSVSPCVIVPDSVFESQIINSAVLGSGGTQLDLSTSPAGNIYVFREETRDRWAVSNQNCFPTIHSSRANRFASIVAAPTFSGYPWDSDGYSNTYGNGAFVYVDNAGALHFRYETQTNQSRIIFVIGISSTEP